MQKFLRSIFPAIIIISYALLNNLGYAADIPIIAVASNAKFALQEISKKFTEQTGLQVKLSFGSSGNFARQISQGAPFECFIAADESFVFMLNTAGLTVDQGVRYALGRLVLFVPEKSVIKVDSKLADLTAGLAEGRLKKFAIANPEHAPYGRAAKQTLKTANLWEAIQTKLVLGENIAQAAQFASSGAVQAGLIAYSLALLPAIQAKGNYALIPQFWHQPIHQRMVLLNQAGDTAKLFYDYLRQATAQQILVAHGFELPK